VEFGGGPQIFESRLGAGDPRAAGDGLGLGSGRVRPTQFLVPGRAADRWSGIADRDVRSNQGQTGFGLPLILMGRAESQLAGFVPCGLEKFRRRSIAAMWAGAFDPDPSRRKGWAGPLGVGYPHHKVALEPAFAPRELMTTSANLARQRKPAMTRSRAESGE